jgi:indolepyruvate ferredoxin oxidoreductase, beta subunit
MSPRPITLLIAALGGEGGGVLAGWVIAAAESQDFPAQSTSIPGVAQRTGATTYYIEILPVPARELGPRRPVLALVPGIGDIDLLLASEFLEAGRAVGAGFVTPDRTQVIASTSRFYVMTEKTAMADGRVDDARLMGAIRDHAKGALLFDMETQARRSGSIINAVMLGALAGSSRLPIPIEAFEAAIRADGKAVDSNLRGFRAGLEAVRQATAAPVAAAGGKRRQGTMAGVAALEQEIAAVMPPTAAATMVEGVRRLAGYQDLAYARRYLERLAVIRDVERAAGGDGRLLQECARVLALRMSYEDVIRVAQEKIDPDRIARIEQEMRLGPDDAYAVIEFLKPGIEEVCSLLPPRIARPILRWSERRGLTGRVHWGMEIASTSVSGFLRFWLLARLRRFRPHGHRFHEEQAAIERWLDLVARATAASVDLACEIAACAGLIKGYGDTLKRAAASYRAIECRVIEPVLAGRIPLRQGIDAVASARAAALVDPEGEGLERCLAAIERETVFKIAAE